MIDIDWTLFVQIANFLVLVFLLNLVLFRPIRRGLRNRKEALAAHEAEIGGLAERSKGIGDEIKARLAEARRHGLTQKESLTQEGAQAEASLLEAVKKEVETRWAEVEKKISEDMAKARKSLKTQAQAFAQSLAAKILGREVS
jgi:F-type H+-transporting ATPase subunit b